MSKVTIHLKGGGSYETTEGNLENTKRLLGDKVAGVEFSDQNKQEEDLTEAITEELVVEVIEDDEKGEKGVEVVKEVIVEEGEVIEEGEVRLPTLEELKSSDKDVLKKMAAELADKKGITKVNARAGVDKLADYIFENQA